MAASSTELEITPAVARLLVGRPEAPPEPVQLSAGPITAMLYEGDLRHVRVGDVELVQRIYVAVRDEVWNTIPGTIRDLDIRNQGEGFTVTFLCSHHHQEIDFTWRAHITGTPQGSISYRMTGRAGSSFSYAKIGLNVHHPLAECLGRPYRARTPGGEIRGVLPVDIEPQLFVDGELTALFAPYDALEIELQRDLEAHFQFDGDLFEMQDHRNWTDANLKSYGTPMSRGWPFRAQSGEALEQQVVVSSSGRHRPPRRTRAETVVEVGEDTAGPLPSIGFGLSETEHDPGEPATALLRAAAPDHVRLDLAVDDPASGDRLARGLATAAQLGTSLELGLFITEEKLDSASRLVPVLMTGPAKVARVFVFAGGMGFSSTSGTTTPASLVRGVRARLGAALPGRPVAGGTNQFFTELNRQRPDASGMDGLVYSVNPQVHAADDLSLMENLDAQADTVRMAAKLGGGLPVLVGPITLVGRYGPFPAGPQVPGGRCASVDPRHAALFCAAWTVGSLAGLIEAGASSLTYYETLGPRGLLPGGGGAGLAPPSWLAFPVYHVFADLAEVRPGDLLAHHKPDGAPLAVLAVAGHGRRTVLIANLTARPQRIRVALAAAGPVASRILDASSAPAALTDPLRFRQRCQPSADDVRRWDLQPYGVLTLAIETHS